jgi:hypothetical protein
MVAEGGRRVAAQVLAEDPGSVEVASVVEVQVAVSNFLMLIIN